MSPLLLNETARHLALWMAYEDIIRVADLKTRASRFERVRQITRVGSLERGLEETVLRARVPPDPPLVPRVVDPLHLRLHLGRARLLRHLGQGAFPVGPIEALLGGLLLDLLGLQQGRQVLGDGPQGSVGRGSGGGWLRADPEDG